MHIFNKPPYIQDCDTLSDYDESEWSVYVCLLLLFDTMSDIIICLMNSLVSGLYNADHMWDNKMRYSPWKRCCKQTPHHYALYVFTILWTVKSLNLPVCW